MIKEITNFQNGQVVVNTYSDDELIKRDGFRFERIIEEQGFLRFIKDGTVVLSIEIEGKTIKKEPIFKNYFTVKENNQRTEIYFP
jgi:hypothetical protein